MDSLTSDTKSFETRQINALDTLHAHSSPSSIETGKSLNAASFETQLSSPSTPSYLPSPREREDIANMSNLSSLGISNMILSPTKNVPNSIQAFEKFETQPHLSGASEVCEGYPLQDLDFMVKKDYSRHQNPPMLDHSMAFTASIPKQRMLSVDVVEKVASAAEEKVIFSDGLALLVECAMAQLENRLPMDGQVMVPPKPPMDSNDSDLTLFDKMDWEETEKVEEQPKGVSRYAPYGARFAARMKDGTLKTSHLAGDLANRASTGKARVDLILIPHEPEQAQLESAWNFYEWRLAKGLSRPTPAEILDHLKEQEMDQDFRKGGDATLLLRNASNFYRRMMEFGKNFVSSHSRTAALILSSNFSGFISMSLSEDVVPVMSAKDHIKAHRAAMASRKRPHAVMDHSDDDWSDEEMVPELQEPEIIEDDDYDEMRGPKKGKKRIRTIKVVSSTQPRVRQVKPKRPTVDKSVSSATLVSNGSFTDLMAPVSQATLAPTKPIKLLGAKGLSRHSPYGTRFSAEMEDGSVKQSFLAGDLVDRVRVKGGRARGELRLILHPGEVQQLEVAWDFVCQVETERGLTPGAAMVLDHLRRVELDVNHRKNGGHLLQKNAGNFFKRVQEFGRRRTMDASYLKVDPGETASPDLEIEAIEEMPQFEDSLLTL